jgi:hypothetical protein
MKVEKRKKCKSLRWGLGPVDQAVMADVEWKFISRMAGSSKWKETPTILFYREEPVHGF